MREDLADMFFKDVKKTCVFFLLPPPQSALGVSKIHAASFTQLVLEVVKNNKIHQKCKYHCNAYYYFAYNSRGKLKSYLVELLRYGNPDMQILGTLKIKLQIYRFLNMPSKNMGSVFLFRVSIYL